MCKPNRHTTLNRRASPYRDDPSQSPGCAALKGRPNPGNTNHCASPTAVHSPTAAQPQPPQTPNGRVSPHRGDPFQSPGCAALQGRPNPGNTNRHTNTNGLANTNHRANTNHHTTPNHHVPRPPNLRPTNISPSTPPTKRSAHAARVGDSAQRGRSGDFLVWARCGGLEVCRIARVVLAPILLA